MMKRILAALALLFTPLAFAVGPNGAQGTISALNANVSSGTATASSTLRVDLFNGTPGANVFTGTDSKIGALGIQLTYAATSTITATFQGSQDEGASWFSIYAYPVPQNGVPVSTATASGQFVVPASGFTNIRVTATAWTAGSVTVTSEAYVNDLNFTTAPSAAYFMNAITNNALGGYTIQAAASQFYSAIFNVPTATAACLQVFCTATPVTVGTTTPTFVIPAAGSSSLSYVPSVPINCPGALVAAAATTCTGSTAVTVSGTVGYR